MVITFAGLISNIVFWIILNKGPKKETIEDLLKKANQIRKNNEKGTDLQKAFGLINKSQSENEAQEFADTYKKFLENIQN